MKFFPSLVIQTPGDPHYGNGGGSSQINSPTSQPPPFGPPGSSAHPKGGSHAGGGGGSVVSLRIQVKDKNLKRRYQNNKRALSDVGFCWKNENTFVILSLLLFLMSSSSEIFTLGKRTAWLWDIIFF